MYKVPYNKQMPCPTDRFIVPIHKEFLALQKTVIENWKKGVINHLLEQRDYKDLSDCRLRVHYHNGLSTPVLSLKPVVGKEIEDKINDYLGFFAAYEIMVNTILSKIRSIIVFKERKVEPSAVEIKVLRDSLLEVKMHVNALRQVVNKKISEVFPQGILIESIQTLRAERSNDDLVNSFYRYVRKTEGNRLTVEALSRSCVLEPISD